MIASFRFDVLQNDVTFRSRINSTSLRRAIRETPGSEYRNFRANTNKKSLWQQLVEWRPPSVDPAIQLPYTNYVVGLEHIPGKGLCARTDVAAAQMVHPDSLKPMRQFRFSELHPKLDGAASMGHGMVDENTGEYFNVVWSYKPGVTEYQVFCTKKSGETYILATIRDSAYYMHSACFTDNYIIITLAPIRINFLPFLLSLSIGNAIEIMDNEDAKFVVISRKKGGIVQTYTHETFSAMHSVSAFEKGEDIVLDWCCSMNAKEMASFEMEDVMRKAELPNSSITRFTLPNIRASDNKSTTPPRAKSTVLLEETGDFPVVCAETEYRYMYMTKNSEGVMAGLKI
ncbi:Carotenoid oxygenase [Gracilaria domingensis]|nr:Carotenoid oxygenase [Gracilaria domingensis]